MRHLFNACGTFVLGLVVACSAADGDTEALDDAASQEEALASVGQAFGFNADFKGRYKNCDEFAGVGFVPYANVAALVPSEFIVIEAQPGLAIAVAQTGSCDNIRVKGHNGGPGVFAQLGVAIVSPDGTGDSNFYQLMFATTNARLAVNLRRTGANARFTPHLSYELTDNDTQLDVFVPRPLPLAWSLNGPITPPDPESAPNPVTVFNYWSQSRHHGTVRQANEVNGIRLGQGEQVTLTAIGPALEAIIGSSTLSFPLFSSPETFDVAKLTVTTNAI